MESVCFVEKSRFFFDEDCRDSNILFSLLRLEVLFFFLQKRNIYFD